MNAYTYAVTCWLPCGARWGTRDGVRTAYFMRFDSACHYAAVHENNDTEVVCTVVELDA